jgi:hypothetical protein
VPTTDDDAAAEWRAERVKRYRTVQGFIEPQLEVFGRIQVEVLGQGNDHDAALAQLVDGGQVERPRRSDFQNLRVSPDRSRDTSVCHSSRANPCLPDSFSITSSS